MLHCKIVRDTVHGRVIRQELTRDLDQFCNAIMEEIENALELNWDTDTTQWKEVVLYDTMLDVVGRISNRVLVGTPLCRNKEYLRHSYSFARNVVITASLLNLCPPILRPIIANLVMFTDLWHYWGIAKFIYPVIKERIATFQTGIDFPTSKHNDYVQWALRDAFKHDDPLETKPHMIAKRLTVLSFAAIQSSVITITNVLFDIASAPDCVHIQQCLRDEVRDVTLQNHGREWTRANLSNMTHIDSALRESMRLWGFISRGVMKTVVAAGGIILPSGERLPRGSKVGVTAYAIHHDEDVYPKPFKYDAFRFSRTKHDPSAPQYYRKETIRPPSMVTSSETFMAFSHGRHACPGRFFAANQLKLLLAAIVSKYDIEPISERPPNPWFNNSIGPPIWAKIRVRRRADSVGVPSTVP